MNARRLVLTVMLGLLLAGCAGRDRRGDTPSETSSVPANSAGPSTQSSSDDTAKTSSRPFSTQTAHEPPTPFGAAQAASSQALGNRDESADADNAAGNRNQAGGLQTAMKTESAAPVGPASGTNADSGKKKPGASAGDAPVVVADATKPQSNASAPTVQSRAPKETGDVPKVAPETTPNNGKLQPGASAGAAVVASRDSQRDGNNDPMPPVVTAGKAGDRSRAGDAPAGIADAAIPQSTASTPTTAGKAVAGNGTGGAAGDRSPVDGPWVATNTGTAGLASGTTVNSGLMQPGGNAGTAVVANRNSQSGAGSDKATPAVTAKPVGEPPRVAVLRPDMQAGQAGQSGQSSQSGAPAAATPGAVVDPGKPAEPPKPPSMEDRSLECDVIELMGKAIGRWRRQGADRKAATNKAIDEVLRMTGNARDRRFVFSGRVYGMLIYRLKQDHTAEGFGAYAHSACLVLRGGKGIVPADETSESRLDQALIICESSSRTPDDLNACISERMENIVRQRGAWNG